MKIKHERLRKDEGYEDDNTGKYTNENKIPFSWVENRLPLNKIVKISLKSTLLLLLHVLVGL